MPQSLMKNYIHLTFSTKNRNHSITDQIKAELYAYLGGICKKLECNPLIVGGYTNHIHILCLLSRKIALMTLIEELKSHSSKWVKKRWKNNQEFYWQKGYGCFSVNQRETEKVKRYILNQNEHHMTMTFQDEYRAFLKEYKIEYNEQYVCD